MAWVGIGCGSVVLIAIVVGGILFGLGKRLFDDIKEDMGRDPMQDSAELVVELLPNLEKISENESIGEMTVRNRETGEDMTLTYTDLAEGNFMIPQPDGTQTPVGSTDLTPVPSWVPTYPNVDGPPRLILRETPTTIEGIITFQTRDLIANVDSFFKTNMSSSGSTTSTSTNFGTLERMRCTFRSGDHSLAVTTSRNGASNPVKVQVHFTDTK